jgi:hypothetical protein
MEVVVECRRAGGGDERPAKAGARVGEDRREVGDDGSRRDGRDERAVVWVVVSADGTHLMSAERGRRGKKLGMRDNGESMFGGRASKFKCRCRKSLWVGR